MAVGIKKTDYCPKRGFNHTSFLFKIAFDLFEALGPFGLDFLLQLFGERGSAALRGDGHGDVLAKVHAGGHDEIAIEVVTGVVDQDAAGAGVVRNLRVYGGLIGADKDHEDAAEVERLVGTVFQGNR